MSYEYQVVAISPGGHESPRDEATTDLNRAIAQFEEQRRVASVMPTRIRLRKRPLARWETVLEDERPLALSRH